MRSWKDIEDRRLAAGISRAEMARKSGISESTVFKGLQRGTKPLPSIVSAIDAVLTTAEQERAA